MEDKIVFTPLSKSENSTTFQIERTRAPTAPNEKVFEAGGEHRGIVINKVITSEEDNAVSDAMLKFRVFLVDANSGDHTQEDRTLRFYFLPRLPPEEHATVAQEFFKELVSPQSFPRDYVGFIKTLMKLTQNRYTDLKKLTVELKRVEKTELPQRPPSTDESILEKVELTEEKVLEVIESAYPNPIVVENLAKLHDWPQNDISKHLENLRSKGLVKAVDSNAIHSNAIAFTRIIHNDSDLQIVQQMPTVVSSKQPTIAIITAQYYEKIAVDSMIDNKETFVRYTTVGESNLYTLGNVGHHRVVSTKLPVVGYTRDAFISAGNNTTRLLGTFQMVDYVFIVGAGGGVPHYTDYSRHVRLGDVVISKPSGTNCHAYSHCNSVLPRGDGKFEFEAKNYRPSDPILQDLAAHLKLQMELTSEGPWTKYMTEGQAELGYIQSEHDFTRPSAETDKLFMPIGERDVIEVAHPTPKDQTDGPNFPDGSLKLHLGPIASAKDMGRNSKLREAFCREVQALAWDSPTDTVIESVIGNCRNGWAVVRGISDYRDGSRKSPWQPYASLAAASVVKSIICALNPPPLESP